MDAAMDIVKVTDLRKVFGEVIAVDGVSFSIEQGEAFGFLGPNGAGKTTTINMVIGLTRPSGGSIVVDGIDAVRHVKKAQAVMGIVPDESNLYDELDGFRNLCFCGSLYGMRKDAREAKAKELLALFGLEKAGNRPFKAYSKGMRRKLTIAAGIIHNPRVLFLDEPTTGIDVESARQIRRLLLRLKKDGTTIFLTTHHIEDTERICDRVAFIVEGRIVAEGTIEELMEDASSVHTVQLTGDSGIARYTGDLGMLTGGCSIAASGDGSVTITSKRRLALSPVLRYLEEMKVSVYEAKELRPSLEDVFVRITGIDATRLKLDNEKGRISK